MVLERRRGMNGGQEDAGVSQVEMGFDRQVADRPRYVDQGGQFEGSEHVDARALGGRDQVAGDRQKDHDRIQDPMRGDGGGALEGPDFRREPRLPIDEPPTEPGQRERENGDPDLLVEGEGAVVPGVVIGEVDHPGPEPGEPDEGEGDDPVKGYGDEAVMAGAVPPHGVLPAPRRAPG